MGASLLVLGETEALTQFHQAIRDRFQRGGSIGAFVLTAAALVAFLYVIYLLSKWQKRAATTETTADDPHKLFARLLGKLKLTPMQQAWMRRAAQRSKLEHPTTALLCEPIFDELAASASAMDAALDPAGAGIDLADLRKKLFPVRQSFAIESRNAAR